MRLSESFDLLGSYLILSVVERGANEVDDRRNLFIAKRPKRRHRSPAVQNAQNYEIRRRCYGRVVREGRVDSCALRSLAVAHMARGAEELVLLGPVRSWCWFVVLGNGQ